MSEVASGVGAAGVMLPGATSGTPGGIERVGRDRSRLDSIDWNSASLGDATEGALPKDGAEFARAKAPPLAE